MRRLRRYESTLYGRIRWGLKELRHESPYERPSVRLKNNWLGMGESIKAEPTGRQDPPPLPFRPQSPAPLAPEPLQAAPLPPLATIEQPKPEEPKSGLKTVHPPFDLEPDEVPAPGETADYPKILSDRREKSLRKAASRREARRRKIDKLRA